MNKISIYLDDVRVPLDNNLIIVKDYESFVNTVLHYGIENIETIYLDHDLSDEHYTPSYLWDDYDKSKRWQESQDYKDKTGYDCAKWLVELFNSEISLPQIYTHSFNPVGADNIIKLVNNWYKYYNSDLRCIKKIIPFVLSKNYPVNDKSP